LKKDEEGKHACNTEVLSAWLGAYVAGTLKEAALSYDKCSLTCMKADLNDAKKNVKSLIASYPGQSHLLEKCLEMMEEEGKIFFANKLGIGENKAAYFELTEILRRNSKKTLKNLYI